MRVTSLRWTSQEFTNVASVSQFATPRDGEASFWFAYGTIPLDFPEVHELGDSYAVDSPVRAGEHSF